MVRERKKNGEKGSLSNILGGNSVLQCQLLICTVNFILRSLALSQDQVSDEPSTVTKYAPRFNIM